MDFFREIEMQNLKKALVVLGITAQLFAFAAIAQENANSTVAFEPDGKIPVVVIEGQRMKPCRPSHWDLDAEPAEIGTRCMTSGNAIFERVPHGGDEFETWKDPNGVIWGAPKEYKKYPNLNAAKKECKKINGVLPTSDEFRFENFEPAAVEVVRWMSYKKGASAGDKYNRGREYYTVPLSWQRRLLPWGSDIYLYTPWGWSSENPFKYGNSDKPGDLICIIKEK